MEQEEEFTRSTYVKILYTTVAVAFTIFLLIFYIKASATSFKYSGILLVFLLIFSVVTITVVIKQFRTKITIAADYIISITTFKHKELLTANIKGIRIGEKNIIIEPVSSSYDKITIYNYDDLNNDGDLTKWLCENFADLDADDLKENEAKVLNDPQLGFTQEEREANLSRAKTIALAYNIAGIPVAAAVLFIDKPAVIILALVYPLAGILIMKFSKGLVKFLSNRKRSVNPSIMLGFYAPALFLFFKSLFDYDITNYAHFWPIAGVVAIIILLLLYTTGINRTAEAVKGQVIFMLVLSCFYGFGSTMSVNCGLDISAPKSIQTTVDSKYSNYNKRMHYYLRLTPWDGDEYTKNVEVSLSRFNSYKQGDTITVFLRQGTLNISWFTLYK